MDMLAQNMNANMNVALMQAGQTKAQTPVSKELKELEAVEEAAREFEAVFVSEMMKPMFEGIKTDGMFGGGKGEEVFRGFLFDKCPPVGKDFFRKKVVLLF